MHLMPGFIPLSGKATVAGRRRQHHRMVSFASKALGRGCRCDPGPDAASKSDPPHGRTGLESVTIRGCNQIPPRHPRPKSISIDHRSPKFEDSSSSVKTWPRTFSSRHMNDCTPTIRK